MPALSPTMEQGKLAKWLKKEGDKVSSGDPIAEIETDKATMEVEAVDEGTIGKIIVPEGTEGVAVNTPIAVLLAEGEDENALKDFGVKAALPKLDGEQKAPSAPIAPQAGSRPSPQGEREKQAQLSAQREKKAEPSAAETGKQVSFQAAGPEQPFVLPRGEVGAVSKANGGGRILASPLARRLASQAGIDLALLKGSGPHGRIIKHDVEDAQHTGIARKTAAGSAFAQPAAQAVQPFVPARAPAAMTDDQILALYEKGTYEIRPLDNMRRTIAARLSAAATTIPHFRLTVDCEIDALLEARERLNKRSPKDGPHAFKLSVNDFVIKAMGMALQQVPDANATFTERGILLHKHSDIGVAVALEGGLFTPIVKSVEQKSLAEISNEMKSLAERARKRRLAPHEYQGGTTAISNLGMFGIDHFDAIINPPHATILAVGRGERKAIVKGDQIKIATIMSCTLACDHRVVDGALGAQLLTAVRSFIEDPVGMLV